MLLDYKYYDELSEAIIKLQESGKLAELKNRWWKEKYGGGSCDVSTYYYLLGIFSSKNPFLIT